MVEVLGQKMLSGNVKNDCGEKNVKKSGPTIILKAVGKEKPDVALDENERLERFNRFAKQMFAVLLRNAKTGRTKNGEILDTQAVTLYRAYLDNVFVKGNKVCENWRRSVFDTFGAACEKDSESSTKVSLNEQEEILYSVARSLGVGVDEVVRVLDIRDAALAQTGKKLKVYG